MLTPLRSATLLSLVFAAFSSLRFVVKSRTTSVVAQLFRPGDQGAVAGNLVMLDRLGIGDNGGVQDGLVFNLACGRIGLLDQAINRRAVGAFRLLTEVCEDLVETLDLVLRINHVRLEAGLRVGICRSSAIFGMAFVSCCSA